MCELVWFRKENDVVVSFITFRYLITAPVVRTNMFDMLVLTTGVWSLSVLHEEETSAGQWIHVAAASLPPEH